MKKFHQLIWDDWNVEHIERHNVTPDEVEQVAFNYTSKIRKGKGKQIYYILGQTEAGRYIFIVLKEYRRGVGRPITAREMSGKERKLYQR